MEVKLRDMYLTNFFEDHNKDYFSKKISVGNNSGVASIIKWRDIEKPFDVHYNFKHETIVDNNYTWVQLALKNQNFWIKAMYDEKDNLIEVYIDVTKENIFNDEYNPQYKDLFLDIIVPRKGHIYQMDDVDLMKALVEGVITKEEYKLSKLVSKKVQLFIKENHEELLTYLYQLKQELEYELSYNNDIKRKVA